MKKYIYFVIFTLILFSIYLYVYLRPRNYEINYTINNFNIKESYNTDTKSYYFLISREDLKYDYSYYSSYSPKRKLITKILVNDNDEVNCIYPKIKNKESTPICYLIGSLTDYNLIEDNWLDKYRTNIKNTKNTYKDIKINNYFNSSYVVWNYRGFYYLKKGINKEIKLFNKDVFIDELTILVDNILFVPDYNEKHFFNKIYLIDMETGKYKTWELNYDISFDSYILGINNKRIYIVDKKNIIEYEIYPKRERINVLGDVDKTGKIFDSNWKDINLERLVNKNYSFSKDLVYNYEVLNNKLYRTYKDSELKTIISNIENPTIVYTNNENVYYLKDDKLYSYNSKYGEKYLMEYFEWNFNYLNKIFVFNF